jgi:hypothetical protein
MKMKEHPLVIRNVVPVRYLMAFVACIPRHDIRPNTLRSLPEKKVDDGHRTVDVSVPSRTNSVPLELSALREAEDIL